MNVYVIQENDNIEQTYIRQFENHKRAMQFFNKRYCNAHVRKDVEHATLTYIGNEKTIQNLCEGGDSIRLHTETIERPKPTRSLLHEAEKAQA